MTKPKFSQKPSIKILPVLEMTTATAFWGFGFVATIWALEALSVSAIMFYRFFFTFVIGAALLFILKIKINWKKQILLSFLPAFFLGACLYLQTWGLQSTTATKSAFLTTLYAVFTPVAAGLLFKKRVSWLHFFWVLVALVGTALIVDFHYSPLNFGDGLTLLSALGATAQILAIDTIKDKIEDAFAFNIITALWTALFFAFFFPFSDGWNISDLHDKAFWGMISLTLGSTLLAFFLQIKAQQGMSASKSSILFLLESPFAFFFGVMILNESLHLTQITGAVLIFVSCVMAQRVRES